MCILQHEYKYGCVKTVNIWNRILHELYIYSLYVVNIECKLLELLILNTMLLLITEKTENFQQLHMNKS